MTSILSRLLTADKPWTAPYLVPVQQQNRGSPYHQPQQQQQPQPPAVVPQQYNVVSGNDFPPATGTKRKRASKKSQETPVRFGRVPKREKAKILAAMQKVNANSQDKALVAELENEYKMMTSTVKAHIETCDYTKEKVAALFEKARTQPSYNQYSSQLICPLNPAPHLIDGTEQYLQDFSERFAPAIQGVVEFAKRIPCFGFFTQCDQVTLLRAGAFEVLLVRLACMFDSGANSLICLNGQVLRRDSVQAGSNARFLLDSMFDFAERLNNLNLSDEEIGLFCSVVIISADRPGLRNSDLVLRVQKKLMDILQKSVSANHPENPNVFTDLMKKIPDLRTLNTLHSEKLLAYKMDPALLNQQRQVGGTIEVIADTSVSSGNYSRLQQDLWGQYNLPGGHPPVALPEERSTSPGQHSNGSGSSTSSSEWSTTESKDDHEMVTSPSRTLCAEELRNPSLRSNFNPSHSYCHDEPWPSNPIQNVYDCTTVMPLHIPKRAIETNGSDHGSSSGDEGYFIDSPMKAPLYPKLRRVDSPTDSGIESGKEHGPSLTPTISVCSSPRSSVDEKMKDIESSDKHESIEDMPVLKRALQAPPIVNPVTLMDEAYRHHKKFRAARREAESPSSPSSQMSLASTHSTLVKTLEQAPRYLSEQQLKSTNLLHHMIMAKETLSSPPPSADSQTFVGQNNNHYSYHSVPSPPSSTSPQTHKMVNGGYYSQPPQPQYSPAAAPVSWPAAQQHSPASTAPVQYEHQNSHPSSFGRSSPPRLLFAPRSSSPLVMHGTCTVQSSSEGKMELSQPLNLSKKLFSTPLLKMES